MRARTSLMTWIFLSPALGQDDVEVRLLLVATAGVATAGRRGGRGGHGHGGGRRHAEALLEVLQQLAQLDHRELGDPVEDLFFGQGCHLPGLPFFPSVLCGSVGRVVGAECDLGYSGCFGGGPPPPAPPPPPPAASTGSGAAASSAGAAASAALGCGVLRPAASAAVLRLGRSLGLGLGGQRLPAGLPLLDQRRDPVGQVPRQGLQEAGHLLHRRGQGAGQAGQQHLAGRQVGQGGQVAGREQRAVGQPALDHEERVGPGEVPQGLGHGADVALHEGQRARAAEVLRQRLVLAAVDGPPDQRVLEDPVVAAGGGERGRAARPARPRVRPRYSLTMEAAGRARCAS